MERKCVMDKFVVTITRQFGSLGRPIAKRMAEILGVEYYDRDIVDQTAQELDMPASVIKSEEEKAAKQTVNPFSRMMFPLGKGTSHTQDKIFEAQQNIIKLLADKQSCIIVGRCSDFILGDEADSIHIYIYASYEARLRHCIEDLNLEETEARSMIRAVDEARDSYHMQYAGFLPDDKRHKDILIDSSLLGVEGTAAYIADAVMRKFGGEN